MATPVLLLLPPSEGKATGGHGRGWVPGSGVYGRVLGPLRDTVADALVNADGGDTTLLGARGDLLSAARHANLRLRGAPTLAAVHRYTGVVWTALDPGTLGVGRHRCIAVVSGLGGLFAGTDPVPAYRLALGARLLDGTTMAATWRPHLVRRLTAAARGTTVVDLLAVEQRAAVAGAPVVALELTTGSGRPGGHAAKAAKGRLARHLLMTMVDETGAPTGTTVEQAVRTWSDPEFVCRIDDHRRI